MNKKINLLLSALLALSFSGCQGVSTDTNIDSSASNLGSNIRMERNKPYSIEKGDQIEKISENPKLKIDSDLVTGKTTVTLISGSAAIIKGAKQ